MGEYQIKRRAVFLDRDGVLNQPVIRKGKPYPPANVGELELCAGAAEGCARLKAAGFLLVVVTNQPDVGRGTQTQATVEEMHRALRLAIPFLDQIEVCYHGGTGYGTECDCRKPKPGMILRAAQDLSIDLETSYLIGDRWRDIDGARAAGCRSIFIDWHYAESLSQAPDLIVANFRAAVEAVLRETSVAVSSRDANLPMNYDLADLPIKIFADGADLEGIIDLYRKPYIKGLTTNPTLMRKVGITDYETFARSVLEAVQTKPISFEVFSDDFPQMRRQALKIRDWQDNVYVKIPVTNTKGESAVELIKDLAAEGVKMNVTALLTLHQVETVARALSPNIPAVVSVFAGRIADTGVDPTPIMKESLQLLQDLPEAELLWASVREVLNVYQAAACGCDIVTVPHDILKKTVALAHMDLTELSLDTVRMFHRDAEAASFTL